MGPLTGIMLYEISGYKFTFISFGVFFIIMGIWIACTLGKHFSRNWVDKVEPKNTIKLSKLLCNGRFTFALMTGFLSFYAMTYIAPIIGIRVSQFNLDQFDVNLIYSLQPFTFVTASVISPHVMKKLVKRKILIGGCFAVCIVFLLAGPSKTLHFPDKLYLIIIS